METDYLLVVTTTEHQQDAERLARMAVEKRLSACAQVEGPVNSTYWWQGDIETSPEWKCSFKTSKRHFQKLEKEIKKAHPYDTPEILAFPIAGGSREYLTWLEKELAS